jgi:uncharacterized protein
MFTQQIRFPVGLIVHSFADVNDQLRRGRPFFIDLMRDGITLYEAPGRSFDGPQPLTPAEALAEAQDYFDEWFSSAERFAQLGRDGIERGWNKEAAFLMHQATERLFHCTRLVTKLYSPRSHDIDFLRSRAEAIDTRLVPAWPRKTSIDQDRFDLLRRAYVEARYSKHYLITAEELAWIAERVAVLHDLVETICRKHLAAMRKSADG